MKRSAKCIQMLQLLTSRGFMTREQLANELETNKRNIVEFKKELEEAGYFIESTTGKYGGYRLQKKSMLPSLALRQDEKRALMEAYEYIKSKPGFLKMKVYEQAMDKLNMQLQQDQIENRIYMQENDIAISATVQAMVDQAELAKKEKKVLKILYKGVKDTEAREIAIHPYEILYYKDAYYCLAYSLKAKDFRNFKFSEERMKQVQIEELSFTRDIHFKLKDYIGKLGLMKEDIHEIEVEIEGMQALFIAERVVGIEIKKEWTNNNTLYLKTMMEGKISVISFLLSLGKSGHLLAPSYLRKEIAEIIKDMYEKYR
ncbi:MAG: WYL domain-containing protein [Erysipelotrichaceae bacterium]|nr:WYL domain-containing protein [Erysipelotrichaceae bacterium]